MKKIANIQFGWHHQTPFIEYALKGENLVGAEIRVLKGRGAYQFMITRQIKKLYLIDIKKYPEAVVKLKHFNVEWIIGDSSKAKIPEELDFVYIDGDHSYEVARRDIEKYYALVKEGGLVGGHDFTYHSTKKGEGVIQAVTEFCVKYNKKLWVESPDWWFYK